MNSNYKWIINDINNSLILRIIYKNNKTDIFQAISIINNSYGEEVSIEYANINDIDTLLTYSMIRFKNIANYQDIIDIPLSNLYLLYQNNITNLSTLEAFSIINNHLFKSYNIIEILKIKNPSNDLKEFIKKTKNFSKLDIYSKFKIMKDVNYLDYQRNRKKHS